MARSPYEIGTDSRIMSKGEKEIAKRSKENGDILEEVADTLESIKIAVWICAIVLLVFGGLSLICALLSLCRSK